MNPLSFGGTLVHLILPQLTNLYNRLQSIGPLWQLPRIWTLIGAATLLSLPGPLKTILTMNWSFSGHFGASGRDVTVIKSIKPDRFPKGKVFCAFLKRSTLSGCLWTLRTGRSEHARHGCPNVKMNFVYFSKLLYKKINMGEHWSRFHEQISQ